MTRILLRLPLSSLALLGVLLVLPLTAGIAQSSQFGVNVSQDTVTVGQHFLVIARLRVPTDAKVLLTTSLTDSSNVDTVSAPTVSDSVLSGMRDIRMAWKLAAWRTGEINLGLPDILVDGRSVGLPLTGVFVRSVLPQLNDTDSIIPPKPPRAKIDGWNIPWLWIVAAIVLVAIAYAVWRYLKRKKQQDTTSLAWALKELQLIESSTLLANHRNREYIERIDHVLRSYISRDIDAADLSLTSSEMLHAMGSVGAAIVRETGQLFAEADLVKFAAKDIIPAEATEFLGQVRKVIQSIDADIKSRQAENLLANGDAER